MASLGRSRFRVNLRRRRRKRPPVATKVVTVAASPAQARRFAQFRKPGFTVTKVVKE